MQINQSYLPKAPVLFSQTYASQVEQTNFKQMSFEHSLAQLKSLILGASNYRYKRPFILIVQIPVQSGNKLVYHFCKIVMGY